ncbi:hypothetical protein [Heyndrickxia oleronia]|uniref:Uncharacterized protein n=1 Tax=Heyndrickxia oleronia TaxID=38875 RepID=A0AAW6SX85_9BACI|nr:hypothetical protein [Heyndrickxia oleronia]MDH5161517.1 hypothetical protein [Heyndrickxia oleronia]
MFILRDKSTKEVFFIEERIVEIDDGYLVVVNGGQWQHVPKVNFDCIEADITKPDDYQKGKYIYDDEKGLIENVNWEDPLFYNSPVTYKTMTNEIEKRDKRIEDLELILSELLLGN